MIVALFMLAGLALILGAGRALDEDNQGPTLFDFVLFLLCLVGVLHAKQQREESEG